MRPLLLLPPPPPPHTISTNVHSSTKSSSGGGLRGDRRPMKACTSSRVAVISHPRPRGFGDDSNSASGETQL